MKTELNQFKEAFQKMKDASKALDIKVMERMKEAGDDESALMDIIDDLEDRHYRGTRHIYEKVLRLQEAAENKT